MTKRFDVRAAAGSTADDFLTVLAPTASSVGAMPTTTLIDATTHKGALYDDGAPRVAMFSTDGTARSSVAYAVAYSGNGRHVIADLLPGVYSVSRGGTIILASQSVGADGTLAFSSASGSFSISQSGAPSPSRCDLNGDGAVNILDVQLAINQALGGSPCGSADLDRNGVCNGASWSRTKQVRWTRGLQSRRGPSPSNAAKWCPVQIECLRLSVCRTVALHV